MSKRTLIIHFKERKLTDEEKHELAIGAAKVSGFNVLVFDKEVDYRIVESEEQHDAYE